MVVALHGLGRQGDALRAASAYRARLREDLGLDTSPEFVALEQKVASDVPLRPSPPPPAEVTGLRAPLRWRPVVDAAAAAATVELIGRDDDLVRIDDLPAPPAGHAVGTRGDRQDQLARAAAVVAARAAVTLEVVELAPVRDEASVVGAVATQLGVQTQQGRSVLETLLDLLATRPLVLVLDNCEHVLDTIARFVDRLLGACPDVDVLATSRELLGLPRETVYKVPALPVATEDADLGQCRASPAVALFLQRAAAANPDLVADDATTRAVTELCRRLDGVPLAIELAAARTRARSPTEITERLADRFDLLTGTSRVPDERHRSLRTLVDWSYQLLDPPSQRLFRRLSTFAGAFDLDAAERVCGYGDVPRSSVAGILASLVDKSMVQATAGPRTTYRLLETLREYGGALGEDEAPELARRHGAWLVEVCERGAVGLQGPDERAWLDRFDRLFDDLRLAVRNALDASDSDTALRIVVAAREHAFRRLRYELIGWAEMALTPPTRRPSRWPRRRSASWPTAASCGARSTPPSSSANRP